MPPKHQHVVVCKTPALALCGTEVVQSPTLARKLSCCLQGPQLGHSKAKCLQPNALSPKLSCCLQDGAGAVFDLGSSVVPGCALRNQGFSRDTVSNTRGFRHAICASCPDRPGDIRRQLPAFVGGIRYAASSDTPSDCKRSAAADTSMVERSSHSSGSAVRSYGALSHCLPADDLETAIEFLPRPRQWAAHRVYIIPKIAGVLCSHSQYLDRFYQRGAASPVDPLLAWPRGPTSSCRPNPALVTQR